MNVKVDQVAAAGLEHAPTQFSRDLLCKVGAQRGDAECSPVQVPHPSWHNVILSMILPDMRMGISATVKQTDAAKAASAVGACHRTATVKVGKSHPASVAWTLHGQNIASDVVAMANHLALLR